MNSSSPGALAMALLTVSGAHATSTCTVSFPLLARSSRANAWAASARLPWRSRACGAGAAVAETGGGGVAVGTGGGTGVVAPAGSIDGIGGHRDERRTQPGQRSGRERHERGLGRRLASFPKELTPISALGPVPICRFALAALRLTPRVYHMNEGHCAFLSLERIRGLVAQRGLSFLEAHEVVAATGVFTTHTPVPAGHDKFPMSLVTG